MKRIQWKIRTLLIAVVIASIALGLFARERRRLLSRSHTIQAVEQLGGGFAYKRVSLNWFSNFMRWTGVPENAFRDTFKLAFEPTSSSADSVSDEAIAAITQNLSLFPEMEKVEYHDCPRITDATLDSFPDLHKLKTLEIRGTSITRNGLARLKQRFPELEITDDVK
ncbi:MAG: hypothetical protein ABL888_12355 [Pirellulaceae bacterium]